MTCGLEWKPRQKGILRGTMTGGEIPKAELTPTPQESQQYVITIVDLEGFNEDLAAVLIEKTDGPLHIKINAICNNKRQLRKGGTSRMGIWTIQLHRCRSSSRTSLMSFESLEYS